MRVVTPEVVETASAAAPAGGAGSPVQASDGNLAKRAARYFGWLRKKINQLIMIFLSENLVHTQRYLPDAIDDWIVDRVCFCKHRSPYSEKRRKFCQLEDSSPIDDEIRCPCHEPQRYCY